MLLSLIQYKNSLSLPKFQQIQYEQKSRITAGKVAGVGKAWYKHAILKIKKSIKKSKLVFKTVNFIVDR